MATMAIGKTRYVRIDMEADHNRGDPLAAGWEAAFRIYGILKVRRIQVIQPQSVRDTPGRSCSGRTPRIGSLARTSGRVGSTWSVRARLAGRIEGSVTGGPVSTGGGGRIGTE